MIGGHGDLEYYARDNIAVDRIGQPLPMLGRYATGRARIIETEEPPIWSERLEVLPAAEVEEWVLKNAGARPWDREGHDIRVLADVAEGRGSIIDSEIEVGRYPHPEPTRRAFNGADWHLVTMMPKRPQRAGRQCKRARHLTAAH